jgi:hypothetical protein
LSIVQIVFFAAPGSEGRNASASAWVRLNPATQPENTRRKTSNDQQSQQSIHDRFPSSKDIAKSHLFFCLYLRQPRRKVGFGCLLRSLMA